MRKNFESRDAFLYANNWFYSIYGNEFTNTKSARGLIYLVRDPRDIVVSYANHLGLSYDEVIKINTIKLEKTIWKGQLFDIFYVGIVLINSFVVYSSDMVWSNLDLFPFTASTILPGTSLRSPPCT